MSHVGRAVRGLTGQSDMLQARRASFLRDAMASLATRTASGMMRRNNSEMVGPSRAHASQPVTSFRWQYVALTVSHEASCSITI